MVYGREVGGRELTFEASGALLGATLVMRDHATDSWWSIISSRAIGGPLDGAELTELPVGRKVQWGDWVAAHPGTRVLSVDGVEHVPVNGYAAYFRADETFRGTVVTDTRLAPKAPVFAFQHHGTAYAVPHDVAEGGAVLSLSKRTRLVVHRAPGASVVASTDVWAIPARAAPPEPGTPGHDAELSALIGSLHRGAVPGAEPVPGFDTFWYTWVGIHERSRILR